MTQEIVVWIILGLSLLAALWYAWRRLGLGGGRGRRDSECGEEPDCADCPIRETCGKNCNFAR